MGRSLLAHIHGRSVLRLRWTKVIAQVLRYGLWRLTGRGQRRLAGSSIAWAIAY